jgi:type I restriction enzyme S subunit
MSIEKVLPEGWRTVNLGQVCDKILGGGTPSTKISEYWNGTIPWISSADIRGLKDISLTRSVTFDAIKNSAANILPKGGIIVVTRVGLGKIAIAPCDISFSQDNQGLILNKSLIDQAYALICLSQAVQIFKHQSRGTTINGVTKKQLIELEIPLPPLEEQHQIVDKIEELFSELDKGIENLKTAQQQLKVYRQAVLKWAFEGKLTNDNVKDGELPEGWEIKPLGNIAAKITDGEHFRPPTQETGIPFLSAKDIQSNGVSFDNPLFISEETAKKALARCNPRQGDILIVSRGATVGRMCIVNIDKTFCLLGSVILIKVKEDINSKYLNYALKSPLVNEKMVAVSGATAQQAIYLRDIKNITIPLCSMQQQQLIVDEIEDRLSVCDKMEETISISLQQAEALRQSILKRAFEGKLVGNESAVI